MSKNELILKNPRSEKLKTAPLGFSWTMLVLGFFVPFYRQDWKNGIIILFLYIITLGLISIPLAFFYNFYYAKHLLKSGYKIFHIKGALPAITLSRLNN